MKELREAANDLDDIATKLRQTAVVELRNQGKTFQLIANQLGLTRARVHQLWTEAQSRKEEESA